MNCERSSWMLNVIIFTSVWYNRELWLLNTRNCIARYEKLGVRIIDRINNTDIRKGHDDTRNWLKGMEKAFLRGQNADRKDEDR